MITDKNEILKALSDRGACVCFTGHRPDKLPEESDLKETALLCERIEAETIKAYREGKRFFLHGMMAGFDILVAETVLQVKKDYPEIQLVSVAPYHHNFFKSKEWKPGWIRRARIVAARSDYGLSLSENYYSGVYYDRNRWLVDHSSLAIGYCSTFARGGTRYTLDYAERQYIPTVNIYHR